MKIKTDENIHPEVAAFLQQHGHDAVTVWDEGLRGTSDANLVHVCRSESRVLVTLDLDFADIRVYPPKQFAGIIVLRLTDQSRHFVLQTMARLMPMLLRADLAAQLWIVDEVSVRVHAPAESE